MFLLRSCPTEFSLQRPRDVNFSFCISLRHTLSTRCGQSLRVLDVTTGGKYSFTRALTV